MPILREAFALVFWVALETQHNAFLNSASHSPNSAKRFLRKRFRSFEVTHFKNVKKDLSDI
ncbi:hypothetical protein LEP1GSC186_0844 [Leptospira noguchii serovar Autumnalis str. ZUN142]|uniref:Uncharacterized protein n=1 Tax=Leptospira noguchii serovar Autumnalis str. ZUN142 TaxID=1085540 RepID=M6UZE2_9LEPT|nr:hypothetical protein LEP1GSC186_0844 [Leptospira noguchii serovar Autumnalis str. ZUN142]